MYIVVALQRLLEIRNKVTTKLNSAYYSNHSVLVSSYTHNYRLKYS